MSKRRKNTVVKINVKSIWEIGMGHNAHMSGSGQHDNRPKRQRTRGDQRRRAVNDGW